MTALVLRAYEPESGELRAFTLPVEPPGAIRLRLRGLPGCSAVQLELRREEEVRCRFEIEVDGEESIVVHLERTEDDRLDAWSQGREVLYLPPDPRYAPERPLDNGCSATVFDLAILVDGTTRTRSVVSERPKGEGKHKEEPGEVRLGRLLASEEPWRRHVEMLVKIAEGLREERELKVGVFAFGDRQAPDLKAVGLRPSYELHPRNGARWKLEALSSDELTRRLLALPPTSGGDFVDALAEALEACARLPWRDGSRRAVLLTGDSPGYSLLWPAPTGANLLPRCLDVDTQALALHRAEVEMATLYHRSPEDGHPGALAYERALLDHAANQYRRLASRPELVFEASRAKAAEVVQVLLTGPRTLARGAAYGVLLEHPGGKR